MDVKEKLTELKSLQLSSVFQKCDEGCKEFLSRQDLKVAMVSLFGYKPCKFEVDDLMKNCRKGMSEEVFISAMQPKLAALDEDDEIRHIFTAFDRHCKGFLTEDDLFKAAAQVTPNLPKHRLQMAFRDLDLDNDGRVSYRDFEYLMKFNTLDAI